jgi:hypothetical protein
VTAKSVNGYFGAVGEAGGQLNTPRGTAVNQTSGNVYVADSANNRISVFSASGAFLRAFGQDVVASGPGNTGTGFEICVAANGDVCKVGITTAFTGGAMQAPQGVAVDASGNVFVSEQNKIRVQKFDANGNFILAFGQDVVESGPGNSPATSAVQTLTITATGGKYKLKFGGKETAELAYNATAAQVQTALTGLTSIGAGNLTVSETSPGVYKFTFAGSLANNPEPLIATESGPGEPLTGGIAGVVNTTTGSTGFEICVAANGDVCKTGVTGETRGAFKSTFNGQLAVAPTGAPNVGDVLVADPANLRVQEFTPAGAFVRAFGFDVVKAGPGNTGTAFEVCNSSAGDACKIGITGSGFGQFSTNSVNRVAEDADGNIYTVEATPNFRVQKFTLPGNVVTPQGNFSEANTKGTATTNPTDVAIDPATKNVLVTKAIAAPLERRILELSSAGVLEGTHMANAGINVVNGIAVRGSTGEVYVSSTTVEARIYVLNTPLTNPSVGISGVTEVGAHSATVNGFVNPNGPASLPYGLTTTYYLAFKRSADPESAYQKTAELDVGRGTTNLLVSKQLASLEAGTSYDVKLVATRPFNAGSAETGVFTFATPAAAAEVGVPSATTAVTAGSNVRAALWGRVSPNSQATTYRFEYGTTAAYGTKVPAPDGAAGSGAADVPVAQFLSGLQPGTTYHFRLVAKNPAGSAFSPDRTFTTSLLGGPGNCANEVLREAQGAALLPDCRAYELVTPADKGTAASVGPTGEVTQVSWQSAEDGSSIVYPIQGGFPDSTAGGYLRMQASRDPAGWLSIQLSAPSLVEPPETINAFAAPSQLLYAAPDLGCTILQSYNPLTADTPQIDVERGVFNLYRRNADGSFELITDRVPLNPDRLAGDTSGYYNVYEVSDDCSRVYFRSIYDFVFGGSHLYESDEGVLRDAGVRPDGSVGPVLAASSSSNVDPAVPGGQVQGRVTSRRNAASPDGSHFFFTAISNEGPSASKLAVFMREDGGAEVTEISRSQTAVPTQGARYEAASADGSTVLFRANYGIAATTSAGSTAGACGPLGAPAETVSDSFAPLEKKACDLYAYDVASGDLTDLSADPNAADPEGAAIQGVVAVSDDGSRVYFAALGQLVPGKGRTYAQNVAGEGSANVYFADDGELSYVATLNRGDNVKGDLFGGGSTTGGNSVVMRFENYSAEASANGSRLVFESAGNLTGYDKGVKAVYLYSADADQLTCLSCRLDGEPTVASPSGKVDTSRPDTPTLLSGARGRAMSADGSRVFFTSPDTLAPGAVAGKRNVYEWEDGRVHFLAVAHSPGEVAVSFELASYLGASASGDDVFIGTDEQLAPQDGDFVSDIYDLRVGGGFAPAVQPVPCQVDEAVALLSGQAYCQPETNRPPAAPQSPSSDFRGAGNPPAGKQPRPKCPKGKVRKHGKCVKKKKQGPRRDHGRAANNNLGGAK